MSLALLSRSCSLSLAPAIPLETLRQGSAASFSGCSRASKSWLCLRNSRLSVRASGEDDRFADGYISEDPIATDDEFPDDVIATLAGSQAFVPSSAAVKEPSADEPVIEVTDAAVAAPAASTASSSLVDPEPVVAAASYSSQPSQYDPEEAIDVERQSLKRALIDSLYGTERGFRASAETRAEVAELVVQLEALNPEPSTTYSSLLDGDWVLAYTSFSELLPLLALGSLPLIRVGPIVQSVQSAGNTVSNTITFEGPVASVDVAVEATFEPRSDKRVQITFETATFGSPQPLEDGAGTSLPSSLSLFGQTLDLSPLTAAAKPLQDAALSVAKAVSGLPPLRLPVPTVSLPGQGSAEGAAGGQQSWLLTTFVDQDLRISRGDGGGLFVLVRKGSSLAD